MICEDFFPFHTTVRDGVPIFVREATADDIVLFQDGFDHLSDRSRYHRFLGSHGRFTDADARRFVRENSVDHAAVGALGTATDPPRPLGIARYVRRQDATADADMALTVVDDHQHLGIGTLLLGALAKCAAHYGIDRFVGLLHSENDAMAGLLRKLGAQLSEPRKGERNFVLPIHVDPARYPANGVGDRMRAAYTLSNAERD